MTDKTKRTAILLGAGASADAGLPTTNKLAEMIVRQANENGAGVVTPWVRALNVIYASMVGHQGQDGSNPLNAVNVETLISAVRLLRAREKHEVAPFVASWLPALSHLGRPRPHVASRRKISDSISSLVKGGSSRSFSAGGDIVEAIAEIARAATAPDNFEPLRMAEDEVLRLLVEFLGAHGDVTYLQPILDLARTQPGGVDVITLNYDLTLESAAQTAQVRVERGVDSWNPDDDLRFPAHDNTVNLIKVHGSLDWIYEEDDESEPSWLRSRRVRIASPTAESSADRLPWIVVGDREKLATDGPTLALSHAARVALRRTDHLVIVGYAFADSHINDAIRDWLHGDDTRTISALDLSWDRVYDYRDFRSKIGLLAHAMSYEGARTTPRATLVEGRAGTHLQEAIDARPSPLPETLLSAAQSDDHVVLTWHGPDLTDASISASQSGWLFGNSLAIAAEHDESVSDPYAPSSEHRIERWTQGEHHKVRIIGRTDSPLTIKVSGESLAGPISSTVTLHS